MSIRQFLNAPGSPVSCPRLTHRKLYGFTLIEILVVIGILGILLSIAIPAYSFFIIRSRVSELFNVASYSKVAVTEYRITRGSMPSTNQQIAVPTISSQFVRSVNLSANGVITITGNQTNLGTGGNLSIILTPTFGNGVITWQCTASGATEYVPGSCK